MPVRNQLVTRSSKHSHRRGKTLPDVVGDLQSAASTVELHVIHDIEGQVRLYLNGPAAVSGARATHSLHHLTGPPDTNPVFG
jgi:hypothetical protein